MEQGVSSQEYGTGREFVGRMEQGVTKSMVQVGSRLGEGNGG